MISQQPKYYKNIQNKSIIKYVYFLHTKKNFLIEIIKHHFHLNIIIFKNTKNHNNCKQGSKKKFTLQNFLLIIRCCYIIFFVYY